MTAKSSLNILIADNESIIRLDVREMLESAGHTVVGEATNGAEALTMAKKLKPDLVIMDIKMPVMDGLTAAKSIAATNIAPVILLTAFTQKEIVERAKTSGVLAYLVKPVRRQDLFPAIEIAVSRHREMTQLSADLAAAKDALDTRKTLDRAKGIIMAKHNLTEEEAYNRIRSYCMQKRRSIKDVAEAILRAADKHTH